MGKSVAKAKPHSAATSGSKHAVGAGKKRPRADSKKSSSKATKKTGLDEIDDLFAAKKTADREHRIQHEKDDKERKKRRRERRAEEAALALGASVSVAASASAASAPSHLRAKAKPVSSQSYTRDDAVALTSGEWADDGLGGIYNSDGYTGRRAEGTGKIYKAHLFNKKGFGTTPDCPFDCDCCYI